MAYCADYDTSTGAVFLTASQPAASSCNLVVFSGQEAFNVLAQDAPFDPTTAGEFWGFAVVTVLFCWWTAKGVGALLSLFRR